MKIFIINLARSVERRESIEKQLNKLHLPYEFIEAIDGHALTLEEIRQHTRPLNYAFKLGEIGCSLSHLKVYREICERGIPKALILEDDAQLTDDLPLVLNELSNIIKQIPINYIAYLCSTIRSQGKT
ncbi:hypothetical protein BK025_05995 [Sodalis sp. TME1]|nr:hypothetical protein BK025_05995 [Sodalis sp. TME1]